MLELLGDGRATSFFGPAAAKDFAMPAMELLQFCAKRLTAESPLCPKRLPWFTFAEKLRERRNEKS